MALSSDQTAMLQLLLERGQGYRELAIMLGIEESEVRARARSALSELAGADLDRAVGLTDYLLGQADPIGRADAVRHLRESPEDHHLAVEVTNELRAMFPSADLPRLPGEPRPERGGRVSRLLERPTSPAGTDGPSQRQARILIGAGGAAVLVLVIVLAIAGAFGGDDDSASTETTTTAAGDERAVPLPLRAAKGSDASGSVIFGFTTDDQAFIEFDVRDLQPPTADKAYVLWFLLDETSGFPLPGGLPVQANGSLDDRVPVPATILDFAAQSRTVAIALNDRAELQRNILEAVQQNQPLAFPGGTVLSARTGAAGQPEASAP